MTDLTRQREEVIEEYIRNGYKQKDAEFEWFGIRLLRSDGGWVGLVEGSRF